MNNEESFSRFVRERRRALDLTQEELARRVGCAAITIRKIEADDLRPSVQVAERLAMALAIPLDDRAGFVRRARAARPEPADAPAPTPAPALEEIGQEDLTGRAIRGYALAERIGAGGMGAVYRAIQPNVEREVAVKIILPAYANHPDFIRRFETEAQLVARLEHPHIVPLYDYWREPGVAYLVMRLLRGGNVQALMQNGPLPLDTTVRLLEQICSALNAAHRIGVIHRDLKPANVLLDEDSNAYLADFGIAKNLGNPNLETHTQMDVVMGSPQYMSPEQIRSLSVKPQTDIYCLGVMLYEMLTGSLPFTGPTPFDLIQQHITAPMPPLSARRAGLPAALDEVIGRATAKDPQDRYHDVLSLLDDFRRALEGSLTARPILISSPDEEAETEPINPYKGLRAFNEADSEDFFGRESLIQQLLARLGEGGDLSRFLAVVGPSGSGKSSVVKAGLLPILRRGGLPGSENWFIVDFMPGPHPFEELEAALLRVAVNPPPSLLAQLRDGNRGLLRAVNRILPADESVELVLVLDQFEEVFTLIADEKERALLLTNLVTAVLDERSRMRLVLTLRADFTDRPLRYVDFGELVQRRSEFVMALTPDELERAILGPAKRAALRLEAGLTSAMIREVGEQPGALPLLQYALTELFEKREGRALTKKAYGEIGGALGALGRRAEEAFTSLDEASQSATRQLFLRLVTLGEGVEDTRRRVLRAELESITNNQLPITRALEAFGKSRLLSFDRDPLTRGPTVEVAHEALLREWPRLREWLNESRADVRMQRQLAVAATEWHGERANHDVSFLLTGARLEQFEGWATNTTVALTDDEQAYLKAGIAERDRREAEERERQQRELETARKLAETERQSATRLRLRNRVITAVGAVAIVLAVLAGLFGLQSNQNATRAKQNAAESQNLALVSGSQAALANGNTDQAIALALQATTLDPLSLKAQVALGEAAYAPGTIRRFLSPSGTINFVDVSPGGHTALTTGWEQETVLLWNLQTGEIIRQFEGHRGWTSSAVFSPDGGMALSASGDGTLILWDIETGALIRRFEGHTGFVRIGAFSSDGRIALSGGEDKTLILWDIQTGQIIRRFGADGKGHTGEVNCIAFSPAGSTALSCSRDKTMILWDVSTGQVIRRFGANGEGHANPVLNIAFSPDGSQVLSGGEESVMILWDIATGNVIRRFYGHRGWVQDVAFSPDGGRALTGGGDATVILWDIATGQPISHFQGHEKFALSVAFSPDSRTAVSSSSDGTLRLWDLEGGQVIRRFAGQTSWVWRTVRSPDGHTALSTSLDGTAILWDIQTGEEIRRYTHPRPLTGVAFSPDGRTALIGTGQFINEPSDVVLWDVETGEEVRRFVGHPAGAVWVDLSPDGRTAVSAGTRGVIILWDVATGQEILRLTGYENDDPSPPAAALSAAFSPDGRTILTGLGSGKVILWDVATGSEIRQFEGHTSLVGKVMFSADGQRAFSGAWDNTAIYWDVATGSILHRFTDHSAAVFQVQITPDGRFGLGGSGDNTTIIWDLNTGEVIRRYTGSNAGVHTAAFSPDGREAVVGFVDGSVALWRIDASLDELIAWTQANRYIPELTCAQRALYRLEPLCPEEMATPASEAEPASR